MTRVRRVLPWLLMGVFLAYPLWPGLDRAMFTFTGRNIGSEMTIVFIGAIITLGLNVVLGYAGILHLGITAFVAAGAYIFTILVIPSYPFQLSFLTALLAAVAGSALVGVLLAAPTLRLRGDYLALVTLAFVQVTYYTLQNLESVTQGSRGFNGIPSPPDAWAVPLRWLGLGSNWGINYEPYYYLCLLSLLLVYFLLRNLERSRLGRAWMAIREDELAATCMGVKAMRAKLSAFAIGAAIAGLGGVLHATKITTIQPEAFHFNRSVIILCCVILGGIGSLEGCLAGAFILIGFDQTYSNIIDNWIQSSGLSSGVKDFLRLSNWNYMIFGLALILMMRFKPEGLIPSRRMQAELHTETKSLA